MWEGNYKFHLLLGHYVADAIHILGVEFGIQKRKFSESLGKNNNKFECELMNVFLAYQQDHTFVNKHFKVFYLSNFWD